MVDRSTERVTRLLNEIGAGEVQAAEELLPLVYSELRRVARRRLAREGSADVPQATSLVHEAYLRLVGDRRMQWANRQHFFAVAGEAMRCILIDRARKRQRIRHGGGQKRVTLDDGLAVVASPGGPSDEELLALDAALAELERRDPAMSNVVKLRFFAGLTIPETAEALELSVRTVNRHWTAAKAWLHDQMS